MKLRPEHLERHLRDGLQSVYVLSGDEPLLLQESTDLIRKAATQQGYSERQIHSIERGFSWDALIADSQALSLFAERKLVELRFSNKPDAAAAEVLIAFAQRPPEDTLLLITLPKLDGAAQKSKWFTALDNHGVQITLYPVDASALPGWLGARAQALTCCGTYVKAATVKGTRNADIPCGAKCLSSTGHVCECSCGGKNHGAGSVA